MPTYDYECQACGHTFEHFQSMSSRRLRTCPQCGERKLQRLVGSGAGLIFRGSGFYETDYKQADRKPEKGEAGEAGESGGTKDAPKTDAPKKGAPKKDAPKEGGAGSGSASPADGKASGGGDGGA